MSKEENAHRTFHRNKTVTVMFLCLIIFMILIGRLVYLMVFQSEYYTQKAKELHESCGFKNWIYTEESMK